MRRNRAARKINCSPVFRKPPKVAPERDSARCARAAGAGINPRETVALYAGDPVAADRSLSYEGQHPLSLHIKFLIIVSRKVKV